MTADRLRLIRTMGSILVAVILLDACIVVGLLILSSLLSIMR